MRSTLDQINFMISLVPNSYIRVAIIMHYLSCLDSGTVTYRDHVVRILIMSVSSTTKPVATPGHTGRLLYHLNRFANPL